MAIASVYYDLLDVPSKVIAPQNLLPPYLTKVHSRNLGINILATTSHPCEGMNMTIKQAFFKCTLRISIDFENAGN